MRGCPWSGRVLSISIPWSRRSSHPKDRNAPVSYRGVCPCLWFGLFGNGRRRQRIDNSLLRFGRGSHLFLRCLLRLPHSLGLRLWFCLLLGRGLCLRFGVRHSGNFC